MYIHLVAIFFLSGFIMQAKHNTRVIVLDRGNYTTCTIILKGASVTSWKINDEEQIFISRKSSLDNYSKYRGGITLIFPHYDDWEFGRPLGFARDLMWDIKNGPIKNTNGDVNVELGLSSDYFTKSCWNYDFELRYSITLKTSELDTRMVIINPSQFSSFEFHFEQHWYLKVCDIRKVQFTGLQHLEWFDQKLNDLPSQFCLTADGIFTLEGRIHLGFKNSPSEIVINNEEEHKIIKIKKKNLPDFNLWNPWDNAHIVDDLDEDEVKFFVAIDSGNVFKKMVLPPNSCWRASQIFEVIRTNKPGLKHKNFYDYFEDIC